MYLSTKLVDMSALKATQSPGINVQERSLLNTTLLKVIQNIAIQCYINPNNKTGALVKIQAYNNHVHTALCKCNTKPFVCGHVLNSPCRRDPPPGSELVTPSNSPGRYWLDDGDSANVQPEACSRRWSGRSHTVCCRSAELSEYTLC